VDVFEDFLNLLLPSKCALCGLPGSNLCHNCELSLNLGLRKVSRLDLTGFATTTYTDQVATLIHEFKEGNQTSLGTKFAQAMLPALLNLDVHDCSLVYMPSKSISFEKRGFVPAKLLSQKLSRLIAKSQKILLPVYSGLGFLPVRASQIADQAALSGQDRRTNLVGTMQALGRPKFDRAILIDDIVTTGATLSEATRALQAIGVEVLGFVTFAETLPKNLQKANENSV
jgi:ComF family protein